MCGKVHRKRMLGDMALIWRGVGMLVEVAKNAGRK